jgi:acyl-CoA synthetase (AMP-forming)/AMP-acid ligase II
MEFNLADLFECVVDHVGDRVALSCGDRHLTYRALDERATRLAHGLASLGVGPADHVGCYLHTGVEYLETMLACFKLRAVPVNVNDRYVADEVGYVCADADLAFLVYDDDLARHVDGIVERVETLRGTVRVGTEYEALVDRGAPDRDFGPRSPDDRFLLYTGGTTGRPKGVVWRQEDIFFAALGGGNAGGPPITRPAEIGPTAITNRAQRLAPFLPPGDPGPDQFVCCALGPLVHASGQWSALGTLLGGGRVVLYAERHVDPDLVLALVAREGVQMLNLVGDASGRPLLDALLAAPGRHDTSSLRLIGSGGSMLSADVKQGLLEAMPSVLTVMEAVGSSEAPVLALDLLGARRRAGAESLRFAEREATMVVDDELRRVTPGSGVVGRLATTGRTPLGYHKDPAKTAATFVQIDGRRWTLPGDMALVDADGTIRLLGRGSMSINTGGEKVYPEEVEAVLRGHPAVADAVVVGVPDPRLGERIVAVVAPAAAGRAPTLDELQDHCRDRLAGYKLPRGLQLVEAVARTEAGKPDYPRLRAGLPEGL